MEEKSLKDYAATRGIKEKQTVFTRSSEAISLQRHETNKGIKEKAVEVKVKKSILETKKMILGANIKKSMLGKDTKQQPGKTYHGINKDSEIKKIAAENKKGVRTKNKKHLPKAKLIDYVKMKRIAQILKTDNPSETVEIMTKRGIEKIVAVIMHLIRKLLIAAAKLILNLLTLLSPVLLFFAPILIILMCIAGLAGNASAKDKNLVYGITGDLKYVSYLQANYQRQYGETGWCGITSFTDILASYGCTSPYNQEKLIDPCDTVKYADDNGYVIIGEHDGVHYLNETWYSSLCNEYGLEFSSVRNDGGYYGEALLDWVNEKLDDGWQVVVCFDAYSKYENGAYVTRDRHYIWLTCYADSNHETYACIDPGNGCADATFLPDATTEGGYRDLIINQSQIIDYTGGTNYITGFAIKMPENDVSD